MPLANIKNKINQEGIKYENKSLIIEKNRVFTETLFLYLNNNEPLKIEVEESSELKIIVELNKTDEEKQDYNVEVILHPNSKLTYLLIADSDCEDLTIDHYFIVNKDASLKLLGGYLNNKVNAKLHSRLVGEGASAFVRAVIISSTDNVQNIDVDIIHEEKHTNGLMHNIAIAGSNGKVKLNGVEKILQGSSKSDSYQNLKGIITSDDAEIEINPILLIDEYDITAGHAATVGKLEELSIYYLMSRGLSRKEAEKLMINGLLRPLIDEIDDEEIKERFVSEVNERL